MTHEEFVQDLITHVAETVAAYERNANVLIKFDSEIELDKYRTLKIELQPKVKENK